MPYRLPARSGVYVYPEFSAHLAVPERATKLALCEQLLADLRTANSIEPTDPHGPSWASGEQMSPYGAIQQALLVSLTTLVVDTSYLALYFGDAAEIAVRIYEEAVDNGENIAYQFDLLDRGIISVPDTVRTLPSSTCTVPWLVTTSLCSVAAPAISSVPLVVTGPP